MLTKFFKFKLDILHIFSSGISTYQKFTFCCQKFRMNDLNLTNALTKTPIKGNNKDTPQIDSILSNLKSLIKNGYNSCPSHQEFFSKLELIVNEYHSSVGVRNISTDVSTNEIKTPIRAPSSSPIVVRSENIATKTAALAGTDSSILADTSILSETSPTKKSVSFTQTRHLHMVTQRPEINQPVDNKNVEDSTKHVAAINLSKEQEIVAHLAQQGEHIFYTGSAGTGKSLLLKALIKRLKEQHYSSGPDAVAVTASTGLAACNIGGMTLNSFTGIGLGREKKEELLRKIKRNRVAKNRWMELKVLIIDEISMVDGQLLDKLEYIGRMIKNNNKPFGGIQVILCGDFYQLPPVPDKINTDDGRTIQQRKIFAFESKFWKDHIKVQVELKKIFRQASDKQFMEMLTDIRNGTVSELTTKRFKNLERELRIDTIEPTRLFSTRREVDNANNYKMQSLPGDIITFEAVDSGVDVNKDIGQKYLEQLLAPKTIQLKVGAQVMMVKNIDSTLVNGSVGTVVGFVDSYTYKAVKDICTQVDPSLTLEPDDTRRINMKNDNALKDSVFDFIEEAKKKVQAEIDKLKPKEDDMKKEVSAAAPVVRFSATVEVKSETSETMPNAPAPIPATSLTAIKTENNEDLMNLFSSTTENNTREYNISEDLSISATDTKSALADLEEKYQMLNRKSDLVKTLQSSAASIRPVVQFKLASGDTRTVVVEKEDFKWEVEDANHSKIVKVQRNQLPLMLAWALSIHKSQGQTLSFVSVDLRHIFEDGQAYVALSRAVHRRGLQVLNFSPSKVTTNKVVIDFYKKLKDAETVYAELKSGKLLDQNSYNGTAPGLATQVRDLYEITASPERFAKRKADAGKENEGKKKKSGAIDMFMKRGNKEPEIHKLSVPTQFDDFSSDDQMEILANFEN